MSGANHYCLRSWGAFWISNVWSSLGYSYWWDPSHGGEQLCSSLISWFKENQNPLLVLCLWQFSGLLACAAFWHFPSIFLLVSRAYPSSHWWAVPLYPLLPVQTAGREEPEPLWILVGAILCKRQSLRNKEGTSKKGTRFHPKEEETRSTAAFRLRGI